MRTQVEVRVGRVTRRTWPFPALVAASLLPVAVAFLLGRGTSDASDLRWWATIALCIAMPLAIVAVFVAGLGRGGTWHRIGLMCTCVAMMVGTGWIAPQMLAIGTLAVGGEVRFQRSAPPICDALRIAPEAAALRAAARGDTRFLAVPNFFGPGVRGIENRCLARRRGVVGFSVADRGWWMVTSPAQHRLFEAAGGYAYRYNTALSARLGISPAERKMRTRCDIAFDRETWPTRLHGR